MTFRLSSSSSLLAANMLSLASMKSRSLEIKALTVTSRKASKKAGELLQHLFRCKESVAVVLHKMKSLGQVVLHGESGYLAFPVALLKLLVIVLLQ